MKSVREKNHKSFKFLLQDVIFGVDTIEGKAFDIVLLVSIFVSVGVVLLESVVGFRMNFGGVFKIVEWFFTILFTVEYILRIYTTKHTFKYCLSFYGLIDLFSILPTYIGFYMTGTHSFLVLRVLRLLRVFRVLKWVRLSRNGEMILKALKQSLPKLQVFVSFILTLVVVLGTAMYLIEGESNGFTSIPRSIYWAIVTLTTVGYGDITPQTVLGQVLSSGVMLLGYAVIAVPTGIVSVELAQTSFQNKIMCSHCSKSSHDVDAQFCKYCGVSLIV